MFQSHIGEFAALLVAVFWTVSALAFESASKRIGSLPVNIIRLFLAMVFLSVYSFFKHGYFFPMEASECQWFWLGLSGFVGFVIGDLFLFKAFTVIGSRFSMLLMTLAPPLAAILGWFFLNENLTIYGVLGIFVTIFGIGIAVISRNPQHEKFSLSMPVKGFLYGLGGAIGQALGLILSKKGMTGMDVFEATQIRILMGIIGFMVLAIILRRVPQTIKALSNRPGMVSTTIGAFFGPFLGVSLSLFSLRHTSTGIASALMSTTPILILPIVILVFKQKVSLKECIGAFISVVGIFLFFV